MKKCEVIVDAATLVVGKGSVVIVSDKQWELARAYLKPIDEKKAVKEEKADVVEEIKEEKKSKKVK